MSELQTTPDARILAILGTFTLNEDVVFTYEWSHGYERLRVDYDSGSSLTYDGTYHPGDGSCDTGPEDSGGICRWCGAAWPA